MFTTKRVDTMKVTDILLTLTVAILVSGCCVFAESTRMNGNDRRYPIMSEQTAKTIAEAIGRQLYGDVISGQVPLRARLEQDVWIVDGVLDNDELGGVLHVEISAYSYCVTAVTHSK